MEKGLKIKANKVLWVATGVNFITGLIYIWSVISNSLITELNWTSKEASLPYTVLTIFFVIAMVISGKIQDIKGPRLTATIGSILMGSGLILSGLITNPQMMIISIGLITGTGVGMINVSTAPPVVKWFPPEKKGMVTGIVVAGVGISAVLYSPLANYLTNTVGISKTLIYIGAGALLSSVLLSQFLENPPSDMIHGDNISKDKSKPGRDKVKDFDWLEMVKHKNFFKLWLMLAFSAAAELMIIGHISNITEIQVGWQAGFVLVILLSIFNTLGRVLGGVLSDKIDRVTLLRMVFILQAINMFAFSRYTSVALISIGVAITGLCYGAGFSVFPAILSDSYGTKHFGVNYGVLFTAWGLGGVIGPMTAAIMIDSTNSYNAAFLTASALLILAVLISFTIKKKDMENN